MDVQDSQRRYWMELCEASFEVIRRRLTENDGEVGLSVLESILQPVGKPRRRRPAKLNPAWISPRHVRVIQNYAAGKHLTEIAREEKISRGTILRILRTTPFRLLEYGGIIEP
jgi:DNA-binding NarL/FixJ family response regulator